MTFSGSVTGGNVPIKSLLSLPGCQPHSMRDVRRDELFNAQYQRTESPVEKPRSNVVAATAGIGRGPEELRWSSSLLCLKLKRGQGVVLFDSDGPWTSEVVGGGRRSAGPGRQPILRGYRPWPRPSTRRACKGLTLIYGSPITPIAPAGLEVFPRRLSIILQGVARAR